VFEPLGLSRCVVGEGSGDVAQPHGREGERNIPLHDDTSSASVLTSAPAGGIRCDLDDMLRWARNWLAPTPAQLQWLSAQQRRVLQSPQMLIPVSEQRRSWDHAHVMAYGYGWRMADTDGVWTVWHTGTLNGMYSELMLLPDSQSGFVFMINGEAENARSVLGEVLLKHFTAPGDTRGVAWYADAQERADKAQHARATLPDSATAVPVEATALASWTGRYRDPWFGEILLCARKDRVHVASIKSPRFSSEVMQLGKRYLLRWDDRNVSPDAWLDFHPAASGQPASLTMAKLDPQGDFSSDYEDLHFSRIGACP
jgi:hypothetical protein